MFGLLDSDGALITQEWAMRRNANEPQHEAGQVKGVSMAHPMFSPNDDFANFEIWNRIVPNGGPAPALRGNYVREGWKIGLGMKYQLKAGAAAAMQYQRVLYGLLAFGVCL